MVTSEITETGPKITEIYSAEQIQTRIKELGKQISADYKELENPVVYPLFSDIEVEIIERRFLGINIGFSLSSLC